MCVGRACEGTMIVNVWPMASAAAGVSWRERTDGVHEHVREARPRRRSAGWRASSRRTPARSRPGRGRAGSHLIRVTLQSTHVCSIYAKLQVREAKGSPRAVGVQVNSSDTGDDNSPCARRPRARGPHAPDGRSARYRDRPESRGQAGESPGSGDDCSPADRKTAKAISASIADAESK